MATTALARAHQQHGRKQQQYQLLRRMEGLSLGSALRSDPHAPALAAAALLIPLGTVLLRLSGLFLLATLAGIALAAPLVLPFSPVLMPAALAVAGLGAPAFFAHRVGDDVRDALVPTKARNVAIT
ncbi:oleosin Zm-II-like [Triticum urartu]|uniref:oleosin Zm-II-like n=1 Tax=Triticum urartu TaxID=4572 RepID=UPI0020445BE0|nr:oleosin Zm-II-like [Triticum urartu]